MSNSSSAHSTKPSSGLPPRTKTLTLKWMHRHTPFTVLPDEYFPCARKSPDPPLFVYGFALPLQGPAGTLQQLNSLQSAIPEERQPDPPEENPLRAISRYISDSIEGDFPRCFGMNQFTTKGGARMVIYVYSSHMATTPGLPDWAATVAQFAKEVLEDLGWESVPEPQWYLDPTVLAYDEDEDFNFRAL